MMNSLLADAARAPSSHNSQPWRFRWTGEVLELRADRSRALPVNDPDDRELTISCGAALFNLRVSAAHAGLVASVAVLPEASDQDLLARLAFETAAGPLPDAELWPFIALRRTHRAAFEATDGVESVLRELARGVATEGAALQVIGDTTGRAAVAALVERGDRALWSDPAWRRELGDWMHPPRSGDGLPVPGPVAAGIRAVVRRVDLGRSTGARDRRTAEESPVIVMLTTATDTPADWLRTGQALQRLLLIAARSGWQAGYLNQPIQVPSLRRAVRALTTSGADHPQLLLRLGTAPRVLPAPPPTARRPLADILE